MSEKEKNETTALLHTRTRYIPRSPTLGLCMHEVTAILHALGTNCGIFSDNKYTLMQKYIENGPAYKYV